MDENKFLVLIFFFINYFISSKKNLTDSNIRCTLLGTVCPCFPLTYSTVHEYSTVRPSVRLQFEKCQKFLHCPCKQERSIRRVEGVRRGATRVMAPFLELIGGGATGIMAPLPKRSGRGRGAARVMAPFPERKKRGRGS